MTKTFRSMLRGAGRIIDISGSSNQRIYRKYRVKNADLKSLRGDMERIGGDFYKAYKIATSRED